MRRTAWIWLAGSVVWTVNGVVSLGLHAVARALLAFGLAALFLVAWLFYRKQTR